MFPIEIIFNILFAVINFIYWTMAFVILYHLVRFGIGTQPKKFAVIFLLGSVALTSIAIMFFTLVDIGSLALK